MTDSASSPTAQQPPGVPALFTLLEIAAILKVTRRTVDRLIERGELCTTRIAGRPRVRGEELARYLDAVTEVHET